MAIQSVFFHTRKGLVNHCLEDLRLDRIISHLAIVNNWTCFFLGRSIIRFYAFLIVCFNADNRAVIGKAVQVVGDDSHVSGLTLSFDLSRYEGDATYLAIATLDESGGFVPVDFEHTGSTLSATLTKGGTYFVLDVNMFLDSLGIMPDKDTMAPASLSARHPEDEGDGSSNDGNANAITIERGEKRSSEGAAPERLMVKRERPRSRGVLSVQARPVQG